MSRLGKKPIEIPAGVEAGVEKGKVKIKGPLGALERDFLPVIKIQKEGNAWRLTPKKQNKETSALWGTYASHLMNMMEGVTKGYSKHLVIEGIGFKAAVQGNDLVLSLGFSHPVKMPIPQGIKIEIEKSNIKISGIDKEMVGQTAAKIRAYKNPNLIKEKAFVTLMRSLGARPVKKP